IASPTSFTITARGADGTTPAAHLNGAMISMPPASDTVVYPLQIFPAAGTGFKVSTSTSINQPGGLSASANVVTVASITGLPTSGTLRIDSEQLTYSGLNADT